MIFVLSFYFQKIRGYSVIEAGLAFLPLTGTFIFSNIASGKVTARFGLRVPMIAGGLIGCSGYALSALAIGSQTGFIGMLPGLMLIPAGMGLAVPAMTTSILSSVQKNMAGTASAVLNAARQVGGAMGVAVYGAMLSLGTGRQASGGILYTLIVSAILLLLAAGLAYRTAGNALDHPSEAPA